MLGDTLDKLPGSIRNVTLGAGITLLLLTMISSYALLTVLELLVRLSLLDKGWTIFRAVL